MVRGGVATVMVVVVVGLMVVMLPALTQAQAINVRGIVQFCSVLDTYNFLCSRATSSKVMQPFL